MHTATTSALSAGDDAPTPAVLHRRHPSQRGDRVQRPSGALRVLLDVDVSPHLTRLQNGNWRRKIVALDQLLHAARRHAEQLDDLGPHNYGRGVGHAHTLHKSIRLKPCPYGVAIVC